MPDILGPPALAISGREWKHLWTMPSAALSITSKDGVVALSGKSFQYANMADACQCSKNNRNMYIIELPNSGEMAVK